MDMGFRAFIFSGYPLLDEADYFARYVLPRLPNVSMPDVQGRRPAPYYRPFVVSKALARGA